jgi:hypothetical protein
MIQPLWQLVMRTRVPPWQLTQTRVDRLHAQVKQVEAIVLLVNKSVFMGRDEN